MFERPTFCQVIITIYAFYKTVPATDVTLEQIIAEFDRQYDDYQNEIYASFLFLENKQKQGETFQDFYSRLKSSVEDCKYNDPDRLLRDKIVQDITDKPLQERLLRETSRHLLV